LNPILQTLADGDWHSGEALASHAGITRAAVWARLNRLRELGLVIHGEAGHGYRLETPLDLLDAKTIAKYLRPTLNDVLQEISVQEELDSTNAWLLEQPTGNRLCIAEYQRAGRGRRGRQWQAPLGAALLYSLRYEFEVMPANPGLLSVLAGVALIETLNTVMTWQDPTIRPALKWPNDVWLNGCKLAGILTEMRGESNGPCHVVFGIGLNISALPIELDQPATCLAEYGHLPDRNRLVAELTNQLHSALVELQGQGPEPLLKRWTDYDFLRGRDVIVRNGKEQLAQVVGIANDGSLRVVINGQESSLYAGEVSIRPGVSS